VHTDREPGLRLRPGHLVHLRQLRLAKDVIDRDWARPLDLDELARHAGYSRYHFVRSFKAVYGVSPGQYLSHRRVERAQELLRTADLSVTEICAAVGFSSLGSFSSRFRQQVGVTPSEYRRRTLGRGAALVPGCFALLFVGGGFHARPDRPAPGNTASPAGV